MNIQLYNQINILRKILNIMIYMSLLLYKQRIMLNKEEGEDVNQIVVSSVNVLNSRVGKNIWKSHLNRKTINNDSFIELCSKGCANYVRMIMIYSDDVDPGYDNGMALSVAVYMEQYEIVKLLLEDARALLTINLEDPYRNPLSLAYRSNNEEIILLLLNEKEFSNIALYVNPIFYTHLAATMGYCRVMMKLIIDSGKHLINNNQITCYNDISHLSTSDRHQLIIECFKVSVYYNNPNVTSTMIESKDAEIESVISNCMTTNVGETLFNYACKRGFVDLVSIFLKNGRVDPNNNNGHPLYISCKKSKLTIVELLLSDSRLDPVINNNSALLIACLEENIEVIQLLLNNTRVMNNVVEKRKNLIKNTSSSKKLTTDTITQMMRQYHPFITVEL